MVPGPYALITHSQSAALSTRQAWQTCPSVHHLTGEILRGSLLERTVFRHKANCEKCASGEGHALWVLTVTYPGSRTRQISLRPEQVPEVRRWLDNYKKFKEALEAICELNHHMLRPDTPQSKRGRKARD